MRNLVMILVVGLGGAAILVWLGLWQVERLQWKTAVLDEIDARITAAPVDLPPAPDRADDQYMPVTVTGVLGAPVLRVLVSRPNDGAGHRLIAPMTVADAGRRVMVDLGFLPQGRAVPPLPEGAVTVEGNLLWPDEVDGFTPDPDAATGLWFARDADAMAATLGTDPVMVVRRSGAGPEGVTPWPVSSAGIPNDHREYAITWFSLAAIWLAMTGFLVYRMRKPEGGAV